MDYAAGFAGAALGYIHDNTRGAIKGYILGKNLSKNTKNMAPIKRGKTKRRGPSIKQQLVALKQRAAERARSKPLRVSKPRKLINPPPGNLNYRNLVTNASGVRMGSNTAVQLKRKKTEEVTKSFQRKVRKALVEYRAHGNYKKIHYARITPPTDDVQVNEDFGLFFNPLRLLEATSVLFDGATPVEIPIESSNTFDSAPTCKLHVIDSYATFVFKNMSQRTYHLVIRENKPKSRTTTTNTAYQDWRRGLIQENAVGQNPQNNTPETLFMTPRICPQFNEHWSTNETKITLGPGEQFLWKLQGPNETIIDFAKLLQRTTDATGPGYLNSLKPFCRNVLVTAMLDLVQDSSGKTGRYASDLATFTGGIAVEYVEHFKLECPEEVGAVEPLIANPVNLNRRRFVNVTKVFSSAQVGALNDIVEDNPQAPVANPIS